MFANGKAIELFIVFDTKLVLFPHKFFAPHIVDFLLDFFFFRGNDQDNSTFPDGSPSWLGGSVGQQLDIERRPATS